VPSLLPPAANVGLTDGIRWFSICRAMDSTAESPRSRPPVPPWVWAALAVVTTVLVFFGYGQAEFLLDAVNLRFCG
jgi:hypothetical protein